MRSALVVVTLAAVLLTIAAARSTKGHAAQSGDRVYEAVPATERRQFQISVKRFITLRQSRNWDRLYLMWKNDRAEPKSTFLQRMKRSAKLSRFVVEEVSYYSAANAWVVSGCASFDPAPRNLKSVRSKMNAYLVNGHWLFSDVSLAFTDEAGHLRECSL